MDYYTISSFRHSLARLLKVKRGVYAGAADEIKREFGGRTIDEIRHNRDMILISNDSLVIKLRLPDKKQRLSRKDGYRLIYLVSNLEETVVFLDIYPKNGPLQKLDLNQGELARLLNEFVAEGSESKLEKFQGI